MVTLRFVGCHGERRSGWMVDRGTRSRRGRIETAAIQGFPPRRARVRSSSASSDWMLRSRKQTDFEGGGMARREY